MLPVTKPFLPPSEEYHQLIDDIWDRQWLTNNGPLVNELELKLKEKLGLSHLLFTSNGTIALQIAIKALELRGEIITTPFSYVATTSSIVWENCTPVFGDIEADQLTIDASKIEALITDSTVAILATHVYGLPCDVLAIEKIAKKHNLKVIYDGAHAFGTKFNDRSLLSYGDITTLSTHATKLFHTIEGGAVITPDPAILKKMAYLRNFGHDGPEVFNGIGINGKNSEMHAAMGVVNLKYVNEILANRKRQYLYYIKKLANFNGRFTKIPAGTDYNYAYCPILFNDEEALLKAVELLNRNKIYPRRYFYPGLNTLDYIKEPGRTPVSDAISKTVLCLPLFHGLKESDQDMICRLLIRSQQHA